MSFFFQTIMIVSLALDPLAIGNLVFFFICTENVTDILEALRLLQIRLQHGVGVGAEMTVGIDERRHHRPSLQRNLFRFRLLPGSRFHFFVRPYRQDPALGRQNRLHTSFLIHGQNRSAIIKCLLHAISFPKLPVLFLFDTGVFPIIS